MIKEPQLTATPPPAPWKINLVLAIGIITISTSAIIIRCAMASAATQAFSFSLTIAASRMVIAATILLPQWRHIQQRNRASLLEPQSPVEPQTGIRSAIISGAALALHFVFWISSLNYTSIAASTVLVTTTPIWTAILCGLVWREAIRRQTWWGILIACVGGMLIGYDGGGSGSNPLLGNGLALVGAWMATIYLLLGRSAQRQGLSMPHYIVISYSVAAIVLIPLPLLFGGRYTDYSLVTYGWFALSAIVPQLIGHTSFNWAVRYVGPIWVSLAILMEPIGASWLGYLIFREVPTGRMLQGSVLLLLGVAIATLKRSPLAQPTAAEPTAAEPTAAEPTDTQSINQ
jgi:drug/metabolite transporter (DMT)-like permease